jgi:hypothetical protein
MAKKRSVRVEETENKARAEVRRLLSSSVLADGKWTMPQGLEALSLGKVPDEKDDAINHLFGVLNKTFEGEGDASPYVLCNGVYRTMAANLLERNVPPSPWRDFILFILRKLNPPSLPKPQRHLWRDWTIGTAVGCGVEAGLKATRGRDQRYTNGAHSACSLVADELKKVGLYLSEDAVEKIWRASVEKEWRASEKSK